jgi:hypothetical protein
MRDEPLDIRVVDSRIALRRCERAGHEPYVEVDVCLEGGEEMASRRIEFAQLAINVSGQRMQFTGCIAARDRFLAELCCQLLALDSGE